MKSGYELQLSKPCLRCEYTTKTYFTQQLKQATERRPKQPLNQPQPIFNG